MKQPRWMDLAARVPTKLPTMVAALLTAGAAMAQAPTATDPRGRWITASGNLEVEITPCGAALCGSVTRVLGNRSMTPGGGEMQPADARSPLGLQILKDFSPVDSGGPGAAPTQWRGEIYNRENGKTYRCTMSMSRASNAAGELLLHAYVGLPLFGKTQAWQRVPVAAQSAVSTVLVVPALAPSAASASH